MKNKIICNMWEWRGVNTRILRFAINSRLFNRLNTPTFVKFGLNGDIIEVFFYYETPSAYGLYKYFHRTNGAALYKKKERYYYLYNCLYSKTEYFLELARAQVRQVEI